MMPPKMPNSKPRNAWATPRPVAEYWVRRLGLVLDVAASAENAVCGRHYDESANGLKQPWYAKWWCNPPYDNILPWVERAKVSRQTGVLLLPSRTDTEWFRRLALGGFDLYFSRGRIQFVPAPGIKASSNSHGSILAVRQFTHRMKVGSFCPKTGRPLDDNGEPC